MANRIRKCYTEKEFEQIIDDFITTGYEIKSKGERNALLIKKKKKDHLKVALLTVWWTFGIGNLIYAFVPEKIEDEVMIKIENKE
ncbi:MAG: hypothetical protein NC247_12875 [Ruminococcus flavefaciens]|nr:hypothetical protein [Ruminococcus flavefaciens]MCM1361823.1 hypothetical protein [Clostridiales bacterium]MCM1435723.1 hypothetical protein [Ruminococcus flavefaciens]